MGRTTVTITSETYGRLNEYKGEGMSFDRAINELLDSRGSITSEEVQSAADEVFEHEKVQEGTDYGHGLEDGAMTVAVNLGAVSNDWPEDPLPIDDDR